MKHFALIRFDNIEIYGGNKKNIEKYGRASVINPGHYIKRY
jgi:hypothetical protein